MSDRRLPGRRANRHQTKVFEVASEKILGRLVNISTGGMMVISERHFEIGELLDVRIILPRPIHGVLEMELRAEARWCTPDENPQFKAVGFLFHGLTTEDKLLIEESFDRFCLVG